MPPPGWGGAARGGHAPSPPRGVEELSSVTTVLPLFFSTRQKGVRVFLGNGGARALGAGSLLVGLGRPGAQGTRRQWRGAARHGPLYTGSRRQPGGWRVGPAWCRVCVPGPAGCCVRGPWRPRLVGRYVPGPAVGWYVGPVVVVMCARGVVHAEVVCPGVLVSWLGCVLSGVGVAVWGFVAFWFLVGPMVWQGAIMICGGAAGHGVCDGGCAPAVFWCGCACCCGRGDSIGAPLTLFYGILLLGQNLV